jgi:hypothetical protein
MHPQRGYPTQMNADKKKAWPRHTRLRGYPNTDQKHGLFPEAEALPFCLEIR